MQAFGAAIKLNQKGAIPVGGLELNLPRHIRQLQEPEPVIIGWMRHLQLINLNLRKLALEQVGYGVDISRHESGVLIILAPLGVKVTCMQLAID